MSLAKKSMPKSKDIQIQFIKKSDPPPQEEDQIQQQ